MGSVVFRLVVAVVCCVSAACVTQLFDHHQQHAPYGEARIADVMCGLLASYAKSCYHHTPFNQPIHTYVKYLHQQTCLIAPSWTKS